MQDKVPSVPEVKQQNHSTERDINKQDKAFKAEGCKIGDDSWEIFVKCLYKPPPMKRFVADIKKGCSLLESITTKLDRCFT